MDRALSTTLKTMIEKMRADARIFYGVSSMFHVKPAQHIWQLIKLWISRELYPVGGGSGNSLYNN